MTIASPTAVVLTSSETRPPQRMRERMSRPKESVPSGKSADGPARRSSMFCSSGSCGESQGAKIAPSATSATRAAAEAMRSCGGGSPP